MLQNPEKDAIKLALLVEQKHVCVYCGRAITTAHNDAHIEHFWPSSKFATLRFSWGNLYASCGPASKKGTPRICGDHKDDWTPANHIEPTDPAVEQKFSFDAAGGINPSTTGGTQAAMMIKRLNLEDPSLRYQRAAIIGALNALIEAGGITAVNVADEIAMWRSVDGDGRLKSFGYVAARYLEDEPIA
ncbi:hypothetical protein X766_31855 [Mesorhizobium sp. LSJC255A00]|uniref:retron system putative HNH endonuclease n=1 Tax=Mesorhizobium sp. LSJC255A00 TaxID=1287313 RepID=UPI0003CF85EA|nr:retron system putative HNH endonuclease [Mesorhizobium sp. LSJC255A00]ESX11130.1 hypothetical protein X766_31855 [Mesorhizobium sp. LSJC255A00]